MSCCHSLHDTAGRPRPRIIAFVAFKMLRAAPVSFALLVAAVAVGVGFQIPNSANLNGYNAELTNNKVVRATGHVLLTARDHATIGRVSRLVADLRALPFVRQATAQLQRGGVVLHGAIHQAVRVVGIDPASQSGGTDLCRRIALGRCIAAGEDDAAVLGDRLARWLGVTAGQTVRVVIPYTELGSLQYASQRYRVVGVAAGGGEFQEDEDLFVSLSHLGRTVNENDAASAVMVFGADAEQADTYAAELAPRFPALKVDPWWRISAFVTNTIQGNRTITRISMSMVVIAVMIPVLALLYIHVLSERRQIGIAVALGFGWAEVLAIYLFKAVIVGIAGCAIGVGIGLGLCRYFTAHPIYENAGFVIRPAIDAAAVAVPVAVIFCTTVLAGLIPAIVAARANPVAELQGD